MHNGKGSKSKQNLDIEEELYELDYEDLVAGIPTRFKYKQVNPEGFGLSAEDILLADDDDLNKYVSLKKIATYREALDVNAGKLDKKRKRLRVLLRERREQAQLLATPTPLSPQLVSLLTYLLIQLSGTGATYYWKK